MKTVTVTARSKAITALLNRAKRENLILRTPDGREYILAELDDFNREIELTRQNKQLMDLLDLRAKQTNTLSIDQVKSEFGLS
ncbi:MAG: hypothetical protein M1434_09000 [Chloroflexi bacterium]|nr:hypothetical protein [Chloroflexota bacterium]MCL5274863.1 hypothetical protein [Chloroflexota bacterium]